jgi:hypothetical protein
MVLAFREPEHQQSACPGDDRAARKVEALRRRLVAALSGSVYAVSTHCSPAAENPRSRWIDGSATVTTIPSIIISRSATHSRVRPSRRRSPRDRTAVAATADPCAMVAGLPGL